MRCSCPAEQDPSLKTVLVRKGTWSPTCLCFEVEVNLLVYGSAWRAGFVGHPEKQVTNSPDPRMSDQEPGSLSPQRLRMLGPGPGTWTHIDDKGSLTLATAGGCQGRRSRLPARVTPGLLLVDSIVHFHGEGGGGHVA